MELISRNQFEGIEIPEGGAHDGFGETLAAVFSKRQDSADLPDFSENLKSQTKGHYPVLFPDSEPLSTAVKMKAKLLCHVAACHKERSRLVVVLRVLLDDWYIRLGGVERLTHIRVGVEGVRMVELRVLTENESAPLIVHFVHHQVGRLVSQAMAKDRRRITVEHHDAVGERVFVAIPR